jgi:hypothetical protein
MGQMSKRRNMQVDESFDKIIKDLQKEIMKKEGKFVSSREITAKIKKEDIEKIIFAKREDIKLNFDRRRK